MKRIARYRVCAVDHFSLLMDGGVRHFGPGQAFEVSDAERDSHTEPDGLCWFDLSPVEQVEQFGRVIFSDAEDRVAMQSRAAARSLKAMWAREDERAREPYRMLSAMTTTVKE